MFGIAWPNHTMNRAYPSIWAEQAAIVVEITLFFASLSTANDIYRYLE
jgi:hypothetical protein